MQLGNDIGDERHGRGLSAADAHLAGKRVGRCAKIPLRAVDEVDDLLRTAPQAHALFGELDPSLAPFEQRASELVLEFLHLA